MNFIFGGRCQGKMQYAKKLYGENLTASDLSECCLEEALSADIIINVQDEVKLIMHSGENPVDYFRRYMDRLSEKILIGTEIGCGIVLVDAFERDWRDQTGWVYQFLAEKAERVDRVWAGLGQPLKK